MRKLLGALTLATFLCVSGAAYAQDAAKQDAAKQDDAKQDTMKKKDTKKKDKKKKAEKKDDSRRARSVPAAQLVFANDLCVVWSFRLSGNLGLVQPRLSRLLRPLPDREAAEGHHYPLSPLPATVLEEFYFK